MLTRFALATVLLFPLAIAPLFAAGGGGGGGGGSAEEEWTSKSIDFRRGYDAVEKEDYQAAVELFGKAVAADPKDADALNYLGYSHRRLGDFPTAMKYYEQALALRPKHLGAHEYLGEAYLELNNLAKAKEHLAQLDDICWLGCKEYRELKAAVRKYEESHKG